MCFHGDGRGSRERVSPNVQAQVKPLLLALATNVPLAKASSTADLVSRGHADHAAHVGRELQNDMTKVMDRGKGEELQPYYSAAFG